MKPSIDKNLTSHGLFPGRGQMTRRVFLKSSGISLVALGTVPSFLVRAAAALPENRKVLVVLFQRGASDGLNIVVPYREKQYYALRPTIAIPRPQSGSAEAAIDLNGFFGFHPTLKPLHELWDEGLLGVIHASGSPHSTRSHFDAQDFMESGTPGVKSTPDGWLNRYLQTRSGNGENSTFRAVSATTQLPRILQGKAPALAVSSVREFGFRNAPELVRNGLEAMYEASEDPLFRSTARESFEAIDLLNRLNSEGYRPARGAHYPAGRFGQTMRQVAQMIKSNLGVEIVFAELGGWDHHVNEGGVQGQLANLLRQWSQGLTAFVRDMEERLKDVVIVSISEFGRTAFENGSRGTDHGHANALFVLGGPVQGGEFYGKWPGLETEQLYEGRDLQITTDFRSVLSEILVRHLGVTNLDRIFPGFPVQKGNFRHFLKA